MNPLNDSEGPARTRDANPVEKDRYAYMLLCGRNHYRELSGRFQRTYFVSGFENGEGVEQKPDSDPRCSSGNQVASGHHRVA